MIYLNTYNLNKQGSKIYFVTRLFALIWISRRKPQVSFHRLVDYTFGPFSTPILGYKDKQENY